MRTSSSLFRWLFKEFGAVPKKPRAALARSETNREKPPLRSKGQSLTIQWNKPVSGRQKAGGPETTLAQLNLSAYILKYYYINIIFRRLGRRCSLGSRGPPTPAGTNSRQGVPDEGFHPPRLVGQGSNHAQEQWKNSMSSNPAGASSARGTRAVSQERGSSQIFAI